MKQQHQTKGKVAKRTMPKRTMPKRTKQMAAVKAAKRLSEKVFVSLVVGAVIILLLALFLFLNQSFVGKAIQTSEGNHFDVVRIGDQLQIQVRLAESVGGLSFQLSSPEFPCGSLMFTPQPLWEMVETDCNGDVYTFGMATISDARASLDIDLVGAIPQSLALQFSDIAAYAGGNDLFTGADDRAFFSFSPTPSGSQPVSSSSSSSDTGSSAGSSGGSGGSGSSSDDEDNNGGSGGLSCTRKWECSDWEDCANGQQRRVCTDVNNCVSPKEIAGREYPVYRLGQEKPVEQQACTGPAFTAPSQQPILGKTVPDGSPRPSAPAEQQPASGTWYWVAVAMGLSIIVAAVIGLLYWHHARKMRQ